MFFKISIKEHSRTYEYDILVDILVGHISVNMIKKISIKEHISSFKEHSISLYYPISTQPNL